MYTQTDKERDKERERGNRSQLRLGQGYQEISIKVNDQQHIMVSYTKPSGNFIKLADNIDNETDRPKLRTSCSWLSARRQEQSNYHPYLLVYTEWAEK